MHGRVLPAVRAEPGFGDKSQGAPGTGYKPLTPFRVSQCVSVPMPLPKAGAVLLPPQSPSLTPRAHPGAGISIKNVEEQDSEARRVLESQEQCSTRHMFRAYLMGRNCSSGKQGAFPWSVSLTQLHWPFHHGLICFSQPSCWDLRNPG